MARQSSNARKRARKKALKEQQLEKEGQQQKGKQTKIDGKQSRPGEGKSNPLPDKKQQNKKRKRNNGLDQPTGNNKAGNHEEEEDDLLALAGAWACNPTESSGESVVGQSNSQKKKKTSQQAHSKNSIDRKPQSFPISKGLPLPTSGFLRDEEPYRESFQTALETSYEGLVWEGPNTKQDVQMNHALAVMDQHHLFRTDVTQPAGLGAKLVPSYVTRCLLGDEGTTYRYLGLRMFAHPWNGSSQTGASSRELKTALQTFETLNNRLSDRTKVHLQKLKQQRQSRDEQEPLISGLSAFNVTLINKMTVHKRLREEPMFGTSKYSVGWHADSSLENYSTIAVYHTIVADKDTTSTNNQHQKKKKYQRNSNNDDTNQDWAVALRVTHNAEGPKAKRLGDITVDPNAPPIAVELPSGSTYFMLDDYNHHHQHAVLAPPPSDTTATIRYSSTHRLLRKGHKVQDMIARCQKALTSTNQQHHGPKRWRSEQILLNELENEWLRQFFIQGSEHKDLLWGYWKEPIQELFQYWEKLEARTLQVVTLLHSAALEKCSNNSKSPSSKADSKNNNAALTTVLQVLGDRKKNGALDGIYRPIANLLLQRAKSRELWLKRERDSVFHKLPNNCRPIAFPVSYHGQDLDFNNDDMATSPLPDGSSTFLKTLASNVEEWGKAFDTGDGSRLSTSLF